MSRLFRLGLVAALLSATGAQWTVVQLAAWSRMAYDRWQISDTAATLAEVFDGRHPCRMCLMAQKGADAQRRQPTFVPAPKLHLSFVAVPVLAALARVGSCEPQEDAVALTPPPALDPPPPRPSLA